MILYVLFYLYVKPATDNAQLCVLASTRGAVMILLMVIITTNGNS